MTPAAPGVLLPEAAVVAPRVAVVVIAVGCGALASRPLLLATVGAGAAAVSTVFFLVLLAVSVAWPALDQPARPVAVPAVPVFAVGVGAFLVGRLLLAGSPPPAPATALVVALNTLAAVAEEAFFRRFTYATLLSGGAFLAVTGSAVLFAAIHVTIYGLWVLPLDFAAGLLFGWQRWVTGSWAVSAATHAAANLAVVL